MADASVYRNHTAMNFGTHLHMQGVSHEDLDTMPADQLAAHATRAGLGRVPSGETLEMTKSYMKKLAAPPLDDPFAGL
jgi:hypothetical protein